MFLYMKEINRAVKQHLTQTALTVKSVPTNYTKKSGH